MSFDYRNVSTVEIFTTDLRSVAFTVRGMRTPPPHTPNQTNPPKKKQKKNPKTPNHPTQKPPKTNPSLNLSPPTRTIPPSSLFVFFLSPFVSTRLEPKLPPVVFRNRADPCYLDKAYRKLTLPYPWARRSPFTGSRRISDQGEPALVLSLPTTAALMLGRLRPSQTVSCPTPLSCYLEVPGDS